jgi:hypothetical protein
MFSCHDAEFCDVFPASCPQLWLCCVVTCCDAEFQVVFFASCPGGVFCVVYREEEGANP